MTKIRCAAPSCKYSNDDNVRTLKNVYLSWYSFATIHEGRQEVLKCRQYEESDLVKSVRKLFENEVVK